MLLIGQNINKLKFNNLMLIELDSLRDDFISTITKILKFFNIQVNQTDLEFIHKNWLSNQHHIYKDQQLKEIVSSLVNNNELDWTNYNLTFFDEIFIQRLLLDQGIAISCYKLNKFPTTTKEFSSLLYKDNL
jgi:hypothetical protein